MADSLVVDFGDFRREVGVLLDIGRSWYSWTSDQIADVDAIVKDGFRDFYFALDPRTGRGHRWSFLYPHATIATTAPYETGTVTIASGVVTLAVGTFPSWSAQGELEVDSTVYDVDTMGGANEVTLIDTTVTADAGSSYVLRQTKYDLPSTFAAIDGPMTYGPQNEQVVEQLLYVDEGDIRRLRAGRTTAAWPPRFCSVIPKPFDATVGQRYQLYLYPPANDVYIIWYRYQTNPLSVNSGSKYPCGGPQHARTIMYAVLAAAERKMTDSTGVYAAQFKEALMASIDFDNHASSSDYPVMPESERSTVSHFSNRSGLAIGTITNTL